jgi:hypothetical protein
LEAICPKKKGTYYLLPTKIQLDQEDPHGELSLPLKKDNKEMKKNKDSSPLTERKLKKNLTNSAMTFLDLLMIT